MLVALLLAVVVLSAAACGRSYVTRPKTLNLTPTPFPEQVDGCFIRPDADCAGADLGNQDLGSVRVGRDYIRDGAN
ncbi:MAG: hypothetical protein FJ317_06890, partial [SAR202 cluster bacterium]|nr:hypothetical protein [SAR202 cluster bacterium]